MPFADPPVSNQPESRRGIIILIVLSVFTVGAWLLCLFFGMFLLGMSAAGAAAHSAEQGFDLRHILLITLSVPVIGLIAGWTGVAVSKPRVLVLGIATLGGWLCLLVGAFAYMRIVLNGPTAPGNWSDRYFKIPDSDRKQYRMGRYDKVLWLRFPSSKILLPDDKSVSAVPNSATIEVGSVPLRSSTAIGGNVCAGRLLETRFETKSAQPGESDLGGNFFADDFRHYYVSADQHWFAKCLAAPPGRCQTLFVNGRLLSKFIVEGKDLCRSPEMNRRLMALAGKWVR